jgi:ribosomal protein L24E
LARHIAFLTNNPTDHQDWPMPLTLRMQGSISCDASVPGVHYPAQDGVCRNAIVCREVFPDATSTTYLIKPVALPNVNLGDWCPMNMLSDVAPQIIDFGHRVGDNGVLARIEVMALAAQSLQELGQLKNPRFDMTYYDPQYLYAVRPDGEVLEFVHEIVEDRNPPNPVEPVIVRNHPGVLTPPPGSTSSGNDLGIVRNHPGVFTPPSGSTSGNDLGIVRNHPGVLAVPGNPQPVIRQKLVGPYHVGKGWSGYANAYAGGVYTDGAVVYAVTPSGDMKWYRHNQYRGGVDDWTAPKLVGWGWTSYKQLIAGGDGIVYVLKDDGTLYWYRHKGYQTGDPQWSGPLLVRSDFGDAVHIFAGGEGVMYVVRPDTKLYWYRHKGYQTGANDWEGPKEVGNGWSHFLNVFSTGEGRIYVIQPNGDLWAYHHIGYQSGTPSWDPYLVLGHGFDAYAYVFPAMWGTPVSNSPR